MTILDDVRTAVRTLSRTPAFTAMAILTVALGIGANTAVFSLVSATLLAPLPYPNAERLVRVFDNFDGLRLSELDVSAVELAEYRSRLHVFAELAAFSPEARTLTGAGEPEHVRGATVTPDLFAVLGITPLIGRVLTPDDARAGAMTAVVISHALWQHRFGGSTAVLGSAVRLDGRLFTVVGVLPPGVRFPPPMRRTGRR